MNKLKRIFTFSILTIFGVVLFSPLSVFAEDPVMIEAEPMLYELEPLESLPFEPIESIELLPFDPIDEEDPYIDDPNIEVELFGEHLDDGRVMLHWERYNGPNFLYYKIVHDQYDPEPYYPEHGYVDYYEDQNVTGLESPEPLPVGDNYIRICVITTDDRRGCGNVLYFFQEEFIPESEEPFIPEFEPDREPDMERPPRDEIPEDRIDKINDQKSPLNGNGEKVTLLKRLTKLIGDNLGVILATFALIIAVSGFTFATRRKQRSISKYINQIDDTYSEYKMKAKRCEAELYRLRDIIDDQLKEGKLDDSAYRLLMQRIENYMVEIQKQIVNEKFGGLPASMKDEMFKMMEDGEITEKEFEAMQTLIKRSELSSTDQDSLLQTIKEFKHQDEMLKRKKK
jgi:hypothetical protein